MDINNVPEVKKKVTISIALAIFVIVGLIYITRYVVRYDMETKAKIEALSEPETEEIDANQVDHIDEALHKLELEFVQIRNDLTRANREIKWLKENCRCREQ